MFGASKSSISIVRFFSNLIWQFSSFREFVWPWPWREVTHHSENVLYRNCQMSSYKCRATFKTFQVRFFFLYIWHFWIFQAAPVTLTLKEDNLYPYLLKGPLPGYLYTKLQVSSFVTLWENANVKVYYGQTDGCTDGRTYRRTDVRTDRRMDVGGSVHRLTFLCHHCYAWPWWNVDHFQFIWAENV